MAKYTLARPPLRLRRARAAHQRDDHAAAPRQAPPGLRDRRQHRARAAGRGARLGQPREREQAREGPRVQPRRPHQPLDLLDQPLAGRRRQARPAISASAIDDHFGSFDKFTAHFTAAALGVQGSGWAGLFWDSIGENLIIQQFFDQQSQFAAGTVPLLLLDVWEHAYYLDYKNVARRLRQGVLEHRELGERPRPPHRRPREDVGPAGTVIASAGVPAGSPAGTPLSTV